jgi:hypothetical protein
MINDELYTTHLTIARRINDEVRNDPNSSHAGKIIGLVEGKIAVVGDSWDDVANHLDQLATDPLRTFIFEAGEDTDTVQHIWLCAERD